VRILVLVEFKRYLVLVNIIMSSIPGWAEVYPSIFVAEDTDLSRTLNVPSMNMIKAMDVVMLTAMRGEQLNFLTPHRKILVVRVSKIFYLCQLYQRLSRLSTSESLVSVVDFLDTFDGDLFFAPHADDSETLATVRTWIRTTHNIESDGSPATGGAPL